MGLLESFKSGTTLYKAILCVVLMQRFANKADLISEARLILPGLLRAFHTPDHNSGTSFSRVCGLLLCLANTETQFHSQIWNCLVIIESLNYAMFCIGTPVFKLLDVVMANTINDCSSGCSFISLPTYLPGSSVL